MHGIVRPYRDSVFALGVLKKILDIAPKIRYNISAIVQMAAPPAQDGGRW